MPPDLIHLLSGPHLDWSQSRIACGARAVSHASWDHALVTCPQCRVVRSPCTCSPGSTPCPACRGYPRTPADGGKRPARTTEKEFQETIRQAALAANWMYFHPHISLHSPAGFLDCTMVRLDPSGTSARLVFAELKMPGKVPSEAQKEWLEALRQVKTVETHLWYPVDLPEILAIISSM